MGDISQLRAICDRGLQAVGFELVELEYTRDDRGWVLRVYIDHPPADRAPAPGPELPKSTITLDDCESASRHLGTVLDVEDVIENAYRLEVSSPGVRRPIRRERDFKRFCGNAVRVQTTEPLAGRKNFQGILRTCAEGVIGVEIDSQVHQIPLASVRKANLEIEF